MRKIMTLATLLFLLLGVSITAHAQENIPEVANLSELQAAIEAAEDGDTIRVTETIFINEPMKVGDSNKTVVIEPCGMTGTVFYITGNPEGDYFWLDNMIISFLDTPTEYAIEINTSSDCMVFLNGLTLNRCGGCAHISRGHLYIQCCEFTNCHAANGGAVSVDDTAWCQLSDSTFTGNSADESGGVIRCLGVLNVDNCIICDNSATNGGAIAGNSVTVTRSTMTGNEAAKGGAIHSSEYLAVINSRIYDNTATVAGADILCEGTATITADDYMTLFSEIITEREADAVAWFKDDEVERYSVAEPTEIIKDTEEVSELAAVFAIYKTPEPESEPVITPTPTNPPRSSHNDDTPVKIEIKAKEKEQESDTPLLACGMAQIDRDNVMYMIDAAKKFVPAQEQLTRGRFAALLYGLLSDESQIECGKVAKSCFSDLAGSPYKSVVNALTGAKVFCGCSEAVFNPDGILTYGQLLNVLTRFVEPKEGYIGSFNPSEHWAATAAITAASYGWIEDVPIDLNAPATYGAFVNLLIKIYAL